MFAVTNDLLVFVYALTSCIAGVAVYLGEIDPSKTNNKLIANPSTNSRITEYAGDGVFCHPINLRLLKTKIFLTKYFGLISGIGQGIYIVYRHFNGLPLSSVSEKAFAFNLLSILSGFLRIWCYKALKHSFTFKLKVCEDQKLITAGPYTYLAHPSYTATLFSDFSLLGALMGPYNAFLDGLSKTPLFKLTWLNPYSIFLAATLAISIYANLVIGILCLFVRIPNEEEMLRAHFGKRYDDFLSKRWRIIPFLY